MSRELEIDGSKMRQRRLVVIGLGKERESDRDREWSELRKIKSERRVREKRG